MAEYPNDTTAIVSHEMKYHRRLRSSRITTAQPTKIAEMANNGMFA